MLLSCMLMHFWDLASSLHYRSRQLVSIIAEHVVRNRKPGWRGASMWVLPAMTNPENSVGFPSTGSQCMVKLRRELACCLLLSGSILVLSGSVPHPPHPPHPSAWNEADFVDAQDHTPAIKFPNGLCSLGIVLANQLLPFGIKAPFFLLVIVFISLFNFPLLWKYC